MEGREGKISGKGTAGCMSLARVISELLPDLLSYWGTPQSWS